MKIPALLLALTMTAAPLHAQQSLAKPDQRQPASWLPQTGKLRVIIDTDAANEVDDQWPIALALVARCTHVALLE